MTILHLPQATRGCGTRVLNGLYLFFDLSQVESRHNLPLPLPPACPCCGEEIVQCRSLKMVNPLKLLPKVKVPCAKKFCPVCTPTDDPAGLMWVGAEFYTPGSFVTEALAMGISKRIAKKPGHLKIGDWVYFAHPKAIRVGQSVFDEENVLDAKKVPNSETKPGIFVVAKLTALHKIINEERAKDTKFIQSLEDQGITPVIEDLPVEEKPMEHILITDNTSRYELVGIPYRSTCTRCDRGYGYNVKGKDPKYCPDCLKIVNDRPIGKKKTKKVNK